MKIITNVEKSIRSTLFLGILLSVFQFLSNRSLWLDEAYLSLNILERNYLNLLEPLEYKQVAPILFLFIEKLFVQLFQFYPDYALRVFPLISFILSALIFYKIVSLVLENEYARLFAIAVLVFNPLFIYYSSEVKQYSSDVLLSVTALYILLRNYSDERSVYWVLGLFGLVALFLSNVAPVILFVMVLYLVVNNFPGARKHYPYLLTMLFCWGIAFLYYYCCFIHNHPHRARMIEEWSHYNGFMPLNPLSKDTYVYMSGKINMIGSLLFGFGIYGTCLFILLFFLGILNLYNSKRPFFVLILLGPIIIHFLLSGFKLYPVDPRLILYTIPGLIILISFGFEYGSKIVFEELKLRKFRISSVVLPILPLVLLINKGYPIKKNELKKAFEYIKNQKSTCDKIYVNYLSGFPFKYYIKTKEFNFKPQDIILGKRTLYWAEGKGWSADSTIFKHELSGLKGRTWIVFTNVGDENDKVKMMKNHCTTRGLKEMDHFEYEGSKTYLYDFE